MKKKPSTPKKEKLLNSVSESKGGVFPRNRISKPIFESYKQKPYKG